MLRKIKASELAVGMYVVDTGLSWLEHPYLYSREGEVPDAGAIREILAAGYGEVFVDSEKGAFGKARESVGHEQAESLAEAPGGVSDASPIPPRAAREPLDRELAAASHLYAHCLSIARDLLHDVKVGGEIDLKASEDLVDDVIASAMRNPDALIALSKLRLHDAYTFTHGVNVSALAVAFGGALGLGTAPLKELGLAGLFHDLGKTGVPDAILNKPGRLTPVEFDRIKRHPGLGRRILAGRGLPEAVLRGVAEHHEKVNGQGYPAGLVGEAVHPFGRILGVADVFDALTSRRAYKEAMLPTRALGVLYGMRGTDFPAELVERFIKFLGPYPVGSFVHLVSGEYGFVRGSNPARPLFPELLVAFDAAMRPIVPWLLDCPADAGSTPPIAEAFDPAVYGLDPLPYLLQAPKADPGR